MPDVPVPASLPQRSREWDKLRHLVGRANALGLGALSEDELWELPSLYRKTLSDLSLLRSRGSAPELTQELGQLCNQAHAIVYRGTAHRRGTGVAAYILEELPRAVRQHVRYVLAAGAIMTLFAVLGWLHCASDRTLAETVLSPKMVGSIQSNLAAARKQADLGLAAQIPREERSMMAAAITANNIGVGVRAFVFGIAGGVPTLIILAFNGYMLGAIGYLYFHTAPGIAINLPLYFIAGIAPHGSIELPAICLASAAGMLLGFSWLFPGLKRRGEALRTAARDALKLLAACAVTLVVAGTLEGFVTPMLPPTGLDLNTWFWIKIAIGCTIFTIWLLWLSLGGRAKAATA
jgi:uncharacterized membrane protein SpoIIM required for sporulation